MSADITLLDLRLRRRLIIGYTLGIAAYAAIVVALYPSFKDDAGLNQLSQNGGAVAAALGASGELTSPPGWLSVNLYANFAPLIVLVATIGYGASAIAGQDEGRTLGLIAAMPLSRRSITVGKLAALVVQAVPVPIVTALCVIAGRGVALRIDAGPLLGTTVGMVLLGVLFGALALLIGAITGSRGTALGVTSAVAAISYLISSLAPSVHWLRPARYASAFFYAVGDNQLQHGLPLAWAGVLVITTMVLAVSAVIAFDRLDVH
jgi:beta-exotoxin I transport system permease protein